MFFEPIRQIVRNLKALSPNLIMATLLREEEGIEELIIQLNREQLQQGINSKDIELSSIGGSYSPITVAIKRNEGKIFDRVTLRDTGDFYNSFSVKIESDGFTITSDSIKDGIDLTDRWGDDIVGLSEISIEQLVFFITPLVQEFVLEYLLHAKN